MPEVERKLAAILSAVVVGYSRLMADEDGWAVPDYHGPRCPGRPASPPPMR